MEQNRELTALDGSHLAKVGSIYDVCIGGGAEGHGKADVVREVA